MSWRRSAIIAGNELRLLRREPALIVQLLFMPLVMIAFLKPAFAPALTSIARRPVNGAAQAVPGMITMFAFFSATFIGYGFFREHGWRTWDRLRSTQARPVEIIAGKVTPTVLLGLVQVSVLFGLGVALFGLAIPGSVVGLAAVSTVMTLAFVAIGVALAAWLRSTQALNLTSNIAGFALAGLGGAFTPLGVLPGWARTIAPVTPTYWAMRGYQAVILHPGGLGAVLKPTLVLLAWAAAFTVAAAVRFRVDETKRFN